MKRAATCALMIVCLPGCFGLSDAAMAMQGARQFLQEVVAPAMKDIQKIKAESDAIIGIIKHIRDEQEKDNGLPFDNAGGGAAGTIGALAAWEAIKRSRSNGSNKRKRG